MRSMSYLFLLAALLSVTGIAGCESSSSTINLSEDELERRERKAIDELRTVGCRLEETEDELIKARGILLRLFPEHINKDGLIHATIIREIRDLRRCFLILDGTPIKPAGLAELKSLGNILLLSVQRTAISDAGLREIEGIVSLRLLRLNRTKVGDDGLRHINRLPELRMLYLTGTKVSDDGVAQLVILKQLQALQLGETRLTDAGARRLKECPKLEFLSLRETAVTDETVAVLKSLKKLKHVDITDTRITAEGMKSLKEALPGCDIIRELTFRSQSAAQRSDEPAASSK